MSVGPAPCLLAPLLVASTALASSPGPGGDEARRAGAPRRDLLLIKLSATPALPNEGTDGAIGILDFDQLVRSLGATAVRPVFRRPPRGRRDPAGADALGIDRWVRLELGRERDDLAALARRFEALRSVERAEPDRSVMPAVVPDDPDYSTAQWSLKPDRADAETAWNVDTDSSEHVIFVIDTGVETTHGDIAANLWINPGEIAGNGLDDDGNGFVDDVHGWNFASDNPDVSDTWGHGIHVNGIIGAAGDNSTQVAGIHWSCRLAQGRIFDQRAAMWSVAAAATVYAADQGAIATNNSWGDSDPGPQVFVDAMRYAAGLDVLQVAAAGNQGNTGLSWPAAYDEMVSVASTDSADLLSWFSSHGDWIDMAAPGEAIFNLWVNQGTASLSGTSMASPHVAGAGALLRSVNPQLTAEETRVTLRSMSDDLGAPGYDADFGHGRLDIARAVDAAAAIRLSTRTPTRPGTVDVMLDAPGEANMVHVLLAGWSGIDPGLELSGFDPADSRILPLNHDLLVQFQLNRPFNGVTSGFIGTLDAAGRAVATFHVAGGDVFAGRTISLCFCTLDPNDLDHVRFVSAPLSFVVP